MPCLLAWKGHSIMGESSESIEPWQVVFVSCVLLLLAACASHRQNLSQHRTSDLWEGDCEQEAETVLMQH